MIRRAAPQCQQIASDCVSAGCISTSMTQAWHHPQPTHKISLAMLGKCIIMCSSLLLEKQCSCSHSPEVLMGGKGIRSPETRPPKVTKWWDGMAATNSTPPSQGQGAPPALTLIAPSPPSPWIHLPSAFATKFVWEVQFQHFQTKLWRVRL